MKNHINIFTRMFSLIRAYKKKLDITYNENKILQNDNKALKNNINEKENDNKQLTDDITKLTAKFNFICDIHNAKQIENNYLKEFKNLLDIDFEKELCNIVTGVNHAGTIKSMTQIYNEMELITQCPELHSKTIGAIGGGFSSGKSSFINSFLDNKVLELAEGIKPVTSIPSFIVCGEQSTIKGISSENGVFDISIGMFNNLSHDYIKNEFSFGLNKLILHTILLAPLEKEYFSNLCLIDTPGYDRSDPSKHDLEKAKNYIKDANFLIWMIGLDAQHGSFPKSDLEFLNNLDSFGIIKEKPLYIIANPKKSISDTAFSSILDKFEETLDNNDIIVEGISVYDAKAREGEAKEKTFRKKDLFSFLKEQNKPSKKYNELRDILNSVFRQYDEVISKESNEIKLNISKLKTIQGDAITSRDISIDNKANLSLQQNLANFLNYLKKKDIYDDLRQKLTTVKEKFIKCLDNFCDEMGIQRDEYNEMSNDSLIDIAPKQTVSEKCTNCKYNINNFCQHHKTNLSEAANYDCKIYQIKKINFNYIVYVSSPAYGRVLYHKVNENDFVNAGDTIIIMGAMGMELEIKSTAYGFVHSLAPIFSEVKENEPIARIITDNPGKLKYTKIKDGDTIEELKNVSPLAPKNQKKIKSKQKTSTARSTRSRSGRKTKPVYHKPFPVVKTIIITISVLIVLLIAYRIFVIQFASSLQKKAQNTENLTHIREQMYEEAISFLDINRFIKGKRVNELYFNSYSGLGNLSFESKKYGYALINLKEAINLHPNIKKPFPPDLSNLYILRGIIFETINQNDMAIDEYTNAINSAYGLVYYARAAYENRGLLYIDKGQYKEAIDDFTNIIDFYGHDALFSYKRGELYFLNNQYQSAIEDFTEVINLNPEHFQAYAKRGQAYKRLNRNYQAFQDFQQALRLTEDYNIITNPDNENESILILRETVSREYQEVVRDRYLR